jgi:hypothetical protein
MSIDKLQGLRCKFATVDEWLSGDVREDVIGAIEQGASKNDDYLIVAISSEGTVRNGSGDTIKMELAKILKGEYTNPHVSIFWYKLDNVDEVNQPEMWIKANPNLGKTVTYEVYQQDVDRINSLKRKAIEAYESLRTQINNKLSNISTRYSEQYVDIPATPVENTVSVFEKAEQSLSSIPEMLTIQPANGDVIRSKNAGTIQLDKQGTYYDTEPTPGKSAQKLHVYHNGERLYDDACITIKKGETIRLTVNLSDNAGNIELLKRTSADGYRDENNPNNSWPNFFSAYSEPSVNRYDSSTYLATDHYDWVITADKVTNGYVTLSQTTFHSTENAPEYKSMYRIKVKVVE